MPVAAQVMRHAATHPDRPAVRGPREELSYATFARRIQEHGRPPRRPSPRPRRTRGDHPDRPGGPTHRRPRPRPSRRHPPPARPRQHPPPHAEPHNTAELPHPHPPARTRRHTAAGRSQPGQPLGGSPDDPALVELIIDALPSGPAGRGVPMHRPEPGDLAWACFSSGSTGRPARRASAPAPRGPRSFAPLSELTGIGAGDVVLVPGPLHSSLYGFAAVHALAVGATVLAPGRWSPGSLPDLLRPGDRRTPGAAQPARPPGGAARGRPAAYGGGRRRRPGSRAA